MSTVDLGRATWWVRLRGRSVRIDVRGLAVGVVLALVAITVALFSISRGDLDIGMSEVLQALTGEASRKAELVTSWRLPRALLGVVLGFGLGMSGAIFQSLINNPLGSPDIIGFSTGSYTGAIIAIVLLSATQVGVTIAAIAGGLAVAAVVFFLSRKGSGGFQLIIVGIAVSAILGSFNTWILLRADLPIAMAAAVWGAGSLNTTPDGSVLVAVSLTAVLTVALLILQPHARILEFGDDPAKALGVRADRVRPAMMIIGVALVGTATAVAGPIGFVALVAPQLAKRLTRSPGLDVINAGLMGAVLLVAGDTVARLLFAPYQLPVGIVTVCLGGGYLVWLLIREASRA